ncbi:MAG: glycosyltransferase family 2 protein [Propionivibrio sp.]|uniref:Glycosyltransferase family 2 protein n=1 Tax=Candidatus Propionivibrio dominans TaxID=2954373 RepID=A0A9D7FEJ0_9RHOO|nr:glycosyltransferase family 2 protein [Candidatus Propionivibrio dominans]
MNVATEHVPLISVVLSTYNRAHTLRRTLDHLAKQDLPPQNFEVVVVDDGSPDDTGSVVAEIAPTVPFTLTYRRHENRGPGYTQNRGIECARAPFVLLLADDIFMAPQALRIHLEHHQAHPEPPVAVLGKVVQSPDLYQSVFLRKWDPFRFYELEELAELPPYRFFGMNVSVKRDFMMRNGMYLEHRGRGGPSCMEDLELGCRLHQRGMRLLYSKAALAYHYHVVTLDQAITRWHERGLNYGEFRRYTPNPELTVYFHVLNFHTVREYIRVLRGPNSFRGAERSLAWHLVRHVGRMITLNRLTARWFWRPLFDLAERCPQLAALVKPKMYRAFLYYHFLRGVGDGRRIYGD